MTVNQKIKNSLKRGDQKRLSEILGVRNQTIAERLNSNKEIDSVDFINAVCKITGRSFSYYKRIELYGPEDDHLELTEDRPDYGIHATHSATYWQDKYETAIEHIALLEQNIKAKDELIDQLKINISLKGE